MNPHSPGAFLLSAALHGAVIAIALLLSYASNRTADEAVKVFELVAGEGGDYMAKEAPALGVEEGSIRVAVNQQPVAQPTPPPPTPIITPSSTPPPPVVQAPPIQPPPKPVTPKKTAPPQTEDQKLKQTIADSKRNAARQIAREQKAEDKKRQEQERKEKDRISKEQFDRENKNKPKQVASAAKNLPLKKIDVDGIAGGVSGGSSASKAGGGGKALKSDNSDELAGYYAYFKQELRKKFEPPPGLSDQLEVKIEVTNNPDGSLSRARVSKTSGSKEFDAAVLDTIRRIKLGPRPDKKSETFEFTFSMRERGEG